MGLFDSFDGLFEEILLDVIYLRLVDSFDSLFDNSFYGCDLYGFI